MINSVGYDVIEVSKRINVNKPMVCASVLFVITGTGT